MALIDLDDEELAFHQASKELRRKRRQLRNLREQRDLLDAQIAAKQGEVDTARADVERLMP